MIKPWIFELSAGFEGVSSADNYAWYIDTWIRAESIGFHGIFFSEHHFRAGALSPSPNLLIATIAARTRVLRLGAMGVVLPLYEPWRVAEEAAMLDHLSNGRLEFGLSSGSGPMEALRVGIPPEELRPRFAETVEILEAALTQESFSHRGRFWKFDNLSIAPRPKQQPRPPMWIAGVSAESAQFAARRGHQFCTGFLAVDKVREIFERYQLAAREAGQALGPERVALRRLILIADDDGEAQEMGSGAYSRMSALLYPGSPRGSAGAPDAPTRSDGLVLSPEESIAGTPARVAEQIIEQCRKVRCGHILGYTSGPVTREQATRSYELWREVIPELQRADIRA